MCVVRSFVSCFFVLFFFFKQKTAYEMRISDWSSDVCSSDLLGNGAAAFGAKKIGQSRTVLSAFTSLSRLAKGSGRMPARRLAPWHEGRREKIDDEVDRDGWPGSIGRMCHSWIGAGLPGRICRDRATA